METNGTNTTPTERQYMNESTQSDDSARVLHVRVGSGNDERVEEVLGALDRGEEPDPYFEVVLNDAADLQKITRPTSLALLRVISQEAPESIAETARLVDRDVRQVHGNLEELERLGIIEFEVTGNAKKPRVWYDRIEVDYALAADAGDADRGAELADS